MQPIGQRIRLIRVERGMSQDALAKSSGITQPFISKIEHGSQKPSANAIDSLASALGKTGQELVASTDIEGAYLADRLSPDEFKEKAHRDEARTAIERAVTLNMLAAYYTRVVRIFEAIHGGILLLGSPALEELYQRLSAKVSELIETIIDLAPDAREAIHLPETTDPDVRGGGVESDMVGIEVEALYDYVDRPAFAKSELYIRKLRLRYPECDEYDGVIEEGIKNRDEAFAGLVQADEWIERYAAEKRDEERRWLARAERAGKAFQERGGFTGRKDDSSID